MKKRKSVSGFTLLELIIVMAIFSVLMLGAMQLLDPVQKIFKRTSTYESNAAMVSNISRYLESTIRYAESLDLYDGVDFGETFDVDGSVDVSSLAHLSTAVNFFRESHYGNIVYYNDNGTFSDETDDTVDPVDGTIRVVIINNKMDDGFGKISEIVYNFTSNQPVTDANYVSSEEYAVNRSYFTGTSRFLIEIGDYSLTSSTLQANMSDVALSGVGESGYSFARSATWTAPTDANLTLSFLHYPATVNKEGTNTQKVPGFVACNMQTLDTADDFEWVAYTSQMQQSALVLINIFNRQTIDPTNPDLHKTGYSPSLYLVEDTANPGSYVEQDSGHQTFTYITAPDATVTYSSFDDKIYFIYAVAREIECNVR